MVSFAVYRDEYERIWNTVAIRPAILADAGAQAERILRKKPVYQQVEGRTGVPWWFVGLCHYRESACNFETYLGNGQPLSRVTTIVPKGRGPFTGPDAFLDGAIDALRLEGFVGSNDWSIARVLFRLEGFNGYGYHGKQVSSPYLWGGSTAYGPPEASGGKYVRDHVFDATVIDRQLGTAVILKCLVGLDSSIVFDAQKPAELNQPREVDEDMAEDALWIQQSLNRLGANPPLAEDGKNGSRTMTAVSAFQQRNGLGDTGLADARTIAAIQQALQPSRTIGSDAQIAARLDTLERQLAVAAGQPGVTRIVDATTIQPITAPKPVEPAPPPSDALAALLRQFLATGVDKAMTPGSTSDPLQRLVDGVRAAVTIPSAGPPVLGQVNGALGSTIGQLLDGKKTAIGIIGAAATQVLANVPATTGLGQIIGLVTPALGLSPYTMPIFLALSAWGVLGKFEKWREGASSPAQT